MLRFHRFCVVLLFLFFSRVYWSQTKVQLNQLQQNIEYYQKGELAKAEIGFKQLAKESASSSASFRLQILNNLGNVSADQGKNVAAMRYYFSALELAKQTNAVLDQGKITKNIGAIHMSLGHLNQAKSFYNEALKIAKDLQNETLMADCYNNLGTVYEQENRLAEARMLYQKALAIYTKQNELANVAMVSSNVAIVLKSEGKKDSCLFYNEVALRAAKQLNDQWMEAAIANNIGNLYGEWGNLSQAERYLNQSLTLARSIKALEIEIMSLESLADAYAKAGQHDKAFGFLKQMNEKQTAFNSLEQNRIIEELNVKYATKEKDRLAASLRKDQERTVYLSISGGVVLMVFVGLLYVLKKRKLHQAFQQELTAATIETEEKARIEMASDLHDNIGQQVAVLSMLSGYISNEEKQQLYLKQVQILGNDIRNLSHKMVPEAFQFGLYKALESLKNTLVETGALTVHLELPTSIFEQFSITEQLSIYRIIQELVGNTLKHAEASELWIRHTVVHGQEQLMVSDNGKGVTKKQLEASSGIGWKTMNARLFSLNGKLQVIETASGTLFQFNFKNR